MFHLAGNLSSASLSATVPVVNEESNVFDFGVNLTWTATAPAVLTRNHEQFRGEGVFINSRTRGRLAPAVATGTVIVLEPNFGFDQNLTPEPSIDAELMTQNVSVVTVE